MTSPHLVTVLASIRRDTKPPALGFVRHEPQENSRQARLMNLVNAAPYWCRAPPSPPSRCTSASSDSSSRMFIRPPCGAWRKSLLGDFLAAAQEWPCAGGVPYREACFERARTREIAPLVDLAFFSDSREGSRYSGQTFLHNQSARTPASGVAFTSISLSCAPNCAVEGSQALRREGRRTCVRRLRRFLDLTRRRFSLFMTVTASSIERCRQETFW